MSGRYRGQSYVNRLFSRLRASLTPKVIRFSVVGIALVTAIGVAGYYLFSNKAQEHPVDPVADTHPQPIEDPKKEDSEWEQLNRRMQETMRNKP